MSGIFEDLVEYGPGGYDPQKPNDNVVRSSRAELPLPLANERAIRAKAAAALASNKTYLALASPTTAQNTAQVKKLTRQVNAVIRLMLFEFSDTTDT